MHVFSGPDLCCKSGAVGTIKRLRSIREEVPQLPLRLASSLFLILAQLRSDNSPASDADMNNIAGSQHALQQTADSLYGHFRALSASTTAEPTKRSKLEPSPSWAETPDS